MARARVRQGGTVLLQLVGSDKWHLIVELACNKYEQLMQDRH